MIARILGWRRTAPDVAKERSAEERVAIASQLQLTWWRFRRHKLAVASGIVVILFYLIAIFADFLATMDPHDTDSRRSYAPPQKLNEAEALLNRAEDSLERRAYREARRNAIAARDKAAEALGAAQPGSNTG